MTNATEKSPKLVADIGGTNARFALIFDDLGKSKHEHLLSCIDFTGPVAAIEHYLASIASKVGASIHMFQPSAWSPAKACPSFTRQSLSLTA